MSRRFLDSDSDDIPSDIEDQMLTPPGGMPVQTVTGEFRLPNAGEPLIDKSSISEKNPLNDNATSLQDNSKVATFPLPEVSSRKRKDYNPEPGPPTSEAFNPAYPTGFDKGLFISMLTPF